VGEDLPLAERGDPQPGHEAASGVAYTGVGELLVIDVDGRTGLAKQHALAPPVLQKPPRPRVAIVLRVVVARLQPVQDQPDHVAGVLLVQLILQLRPNRVVGRCHHVA